MILRLRNGPEVLSYEIAVSQRKLCVWLQPDTSSRGGRFESRIPGVAWYALFAFPGAIEAALLLCVAMAIYYFLRVRRLRPFPVQVRVAYFAWLLMGLLPAMAWMHYVALAGTTAMVTVGYCPLARTLSLLWFNRVEPFTLTLVRRVLLSPPDGGLFYHCRAIGFSFV